MTQYSTRMVIVHWLTLALLIAALFLGGSANDARHAGNPTLIGYLAHGLVGASVMLLILARLYFRRKDGVPPPMGNTPMDKVAKGIQHLLYAVLLLLPLSGILQTAKSGLCDALTSWDATLLPKNFDGVTPHVVHEVLVKVMIALVIVHILGAIKHAIMKDGLMARMSLARKG